MQALHMLEKPLDLDGNDRPCFPGSFQPAKSFPTLKGMAGPGHALVF